MKLEFKILFFVLLLFPLIPVNAQHDEPFEFTWTIINYYSSNFAPISQLEQEQAVERSLQIWADHLNMNLVFVKNAAKSEVYCWVTFERIPNIGHGGGIPGKYCQFTIGSNQLLYIGERPDSTFIHRNLEAIAAHEGGHGFGLGHYNVGNCIMFTNYGDGLGPPCPQEISDLKLIWANVENPPPHPIVDGSMKSLSAPTQVIQGDIVPIAFTLENLGNIEYNNIIWFFDKTDLSVIQSGPFHELSASQTESGIVLWNTSTASLGTHEIQGHWLSINGDINTSNNFKTIFITVVDSIPPPPEPEPEPIPEPEPTPIPIDHTVNFIESIGITDVITANLIIGEEPTPEPEPLTLEERIVRLEAFHGI